MKPMAISDPRSASSNATVIVPMRLASKTLIFAVWRELSKQRMCDNGNQTVALSFNGLEKSGFSGGAFFEFRIELWVWPPLDLGAGATRISSGEGSLAPYRP